MKFDVLGSTEVRVCHGEAQEALMQGKIEQGEVGATEHILGDVQIRATRCERELPEHGQPERDAYARDEARIAAVTSLTIQLQHPVAEHRGEAK